MRKKALQQTLQTTPSLNLFQGFFQAALKNDLPIAIWRLPRDDVQNVVVDFSGRAQQLKLDLEESRPGFAFSRFLNPELKETYFLNADLHYSTALEQIEYLTPPKELNEQTLDYQQRFLQSLEEIVDNPQAHKPVFPEATIPARLHIASEADYTRLVQKGVEAIKQGTFKKVVLSRAQSVALPQGFDHVQTFMKLCERYSNALTYLVYIPQVGLWMGATPETLISTNEQYFRTIALAGTQTYNPDIPLSHTAWMQKEIEEQAMVSRYIINCFKKIRLREFEEEGPKTVIAGSLAHLCTRFKVDMQEVNFPELGTVMLDLLHPTSAVCGMPKHTAQDFILKNEHYDRGFYSGFIGPVNIERESHLFVNLRCMQLLGNQAILYAGAGITEDSMPDREWLETEMKCKTMLSVL